MFKNWLIKGDCHGSFTWMTNGCLDDYKPEETAIIVLGDFSVNYFLDKKDERLKKELNERGYTFYVVRGNHEARPIDVPEYKLVYDEEVGNQVWVQERFPNLRFFMDYGEYKIDKYSVAVIGGAYSVDKWWRLQRAGVMSKLHPYYHDPKRTGWFSNEQLTEDEMKEAYNLFVNKTYDFVFSHTCPISWQPTDLFLSVVDQSGVDNSMEFWLEYLKNSIIWDVWCFGHYHGDRIEKPHVEMYYRDIEDLEVIWERWERYDKTGKLDWWLNKSPNFDLN